VVSDEPIPESPDEPEHPADKILGADWIEPSYARFKKAWAEHDQHARLVELQAERDANGEPTSRVQPQRSRMDRCRSSRAA
jgi:hypothetical protein